MARTRLEYEIITTHGPVSGPLLGGAGALFLSVAGRVFPHAAPDWLPPALATMMIVIAVAVGYKKKTPTNNIAYRCACWAGFAGWTYVTIHIGFQMWLILIGGLALIAAGATMRFFEVEEKTSANQAIADARRRMSDLEYLEFLIMKYAGLAKDEPVTVTKVEDWPNKAGTTFHVVGTLASTFSWKKLAAVCEELASGLRLPAGCTVSAHPTDGHQGTAFLRVCRVNESHLPVPFEPPRGPVSIDGPQKLGQHPDRRPTMVNFRQDSVIVVGKRKAGKTVCMHTITGRFAYCYDALIWQVDLNGGSMSAPWVLAGGNVVDWAAPTAREALLMAAVATAIALDRKSRYQRMMYHHRTDVLPVGNGVTICNVCNEAHPPQIMIMVDEGGEVTGDEVDPLAKKAAEELRKLQRIGRAVGVNIVLSYQRATSDYMPSQIKKGGDIVIALRVKDSSEYAYAFDDWTKGVTPDLLVHNGMAWIQNGTGPIELFRGCYTEVDTIQSISDDTRSYRPQIDKAAARIGGDVYGGRWDRPDIANWAAKIRGEIDDETFEGGELTVEGILAGERGGGGSAPSSAVGLMADIVANGAANTPKAVTPKDPAKAPEPVAETVPVRAKEDLSRGEIDEILARMAAELDGIDSDDPDADGPVIPTQQTPRPAEPQPEPERASLTAAEKMLIRRETIVAFVRSKGTDGAKTEEIIEYVRLAGLLGNRDTTVKDDLTRLCDAKSLVRGKYAMYHTPENAPE